MPNNDVEGANEDKGGLIPKDNARITKYLFDAAFDTTLACFSFPMVLFMPMILGAYEKPPVLLVLAMITSMTAGTMLGLVITSPLLVLIPLVYVAERFIRAIAHRIRRLL